MSSTRLVGVIESGAAQRWEKSNIFSVKQENAIKSKRTRMPGMNKSTIGVRDSLCPYLYMRKP
jgi:hypothetical protein